MSKPAKAADAVADAVIATSAGLAGVTLSDIDTIISIIAGSVAIVAGLTALIWRIRHWKNRDD